MQPVIETLGALERRVDLTVPTAEVQREVDLRLQKMARDVSMPGFRKGKVPMRMVAASYGARIQAEVLSDRVGRAIDSAVSANKLRLAGSPRIEAKESPEAAQLAFSATFEVMPAIRIGDLAATQVQRATCGVGEAEVDRTLEIMRRQRASFSAVEREARAGDRVSVDFAGTIDGAAFPGGSASDFKFTLGEGRMLPAFDTAVTGMKTGESRSFPLAFPADYHGAEVAGKTAQFEVTLQRAEEAVLPELDADFARLLGIPDGDLARLRTEVRTNLEREVTSRLRARTKDSVMEALLSSATFDVPRSLVSREQQELARQAQARFGGGAAPAEGEPPAQLLEMVAPQAERRVRLGLIIGEIVQAEKLQPRQDQVRRAIENMAQSYENPSEVMQWYLGDRNRIAEVEAMVTEENVTEWVMGRARVSEVAVPFDELMGHR